MKKILILIIAVIVSIPFLSPDIKITWTMYLGMPLIILMGSAGAAIVTRKIEAIIAGMIISALWPALIELIIRHFPFQFALRGQDPSPLLSPIIYP